MSDESESLVVDLSQVSPSKFERERQAFRRMLPQLMQTHHNEYVAVHDEQVEDTGPDRLSVAMRVLNRIGNVDIYVGWVSDQPEPVMRSGVRRQIGSGTH
jgi:hypothetical protein